MVGEGAFPPRSSSGSPPMAGWSWYTVSGGLAAAALLIAGVALRSTSPGDMSAARPPESSAPAGRTSLSAGPSGSLPHIVFFLLDDAGYNDVGYNSVDMPLVSPIMDSLMRAGVRLTNYYAQPSCTPTRASLMTGRYPVRIGMQHDCLQPGSAWGLSTQETLLPQLLKESGYYTAMVGKWDLGHFTESRWPTNRGFDLWTGFTCRGLSSYTEYTNSDYHDIQKGTAPFPEALGTYSTFLFRDEALRAIETYAGTRSQDSGNQEAPQGSKALFLYFAFNAIHDTVGVPPEMLDDPLFEELHSEITLDKRKLAAGAMFLADKAVGDVVTALKDHDLYDNSVLVVASDNGGSPADGGNNWPLRGAKKEYFQGGILVPSFIHSPLLATSVVGTSFSGLVHVSDWLPTLVQGAAGISLPSNLEIDGVNQWPVLAHGISTATRFRRGLRAEVLHNMDYITGDNLAASADGVLGAMTRVVEGVLYKFIYHVTDEADAGFGWYLPYSSSSYFPPNTPNVDGNGGTCFLFNLDDDPNEETNLCFHQDYESVRGVFFTRLCAHWEKISDANYVPKVSGTEKKNMQSAFDSNEGFITWWHQGDTELEDSAESSILGSPPSQYPVADFMAKIAPLTCPFLW